MASLGQQPSRPAVLPLRLGGKPNGHGLGFRVEGSFAKFHARRDDLRIHYTMTDAVLRHVYACIYIYIHTYAYIYRGMDKGVYIYIEI